MDSDDKKVLKEVLELSRENNKMLHKMKRAAFLNKLVRVFYWIIILGSAVSVYYYIQPVLQQLIRTYTDLLDTASQVKEATNALPIKQLNDLKSGGTANIDPKTIQQAVTPELIDQFRGLLENFGK